MVDELVNLVHGEELAGVVRVVRVVQHSLIMNFTPGSETQVNE